MPTRRWSDTVRFEWSALDAWFEEDEEVYVHPRNPYTRVDALRSSRLVTVALDGVTLAESAATVMVFETGLPTRYYFDRTAVDFTYLVPRRPGPSARTRAGPASTGRPRWVTRRSWTWPGRTTSRTRALTPINNLVAFYNEDVDLTVDGRLMERPGRGGHRVS